MRTCSKAVAAGSASLLLACAASAGQIDAGAYVLTFDNALGTPAVESISGLTRYTFDPLLMAGPASGDPDYTVQMQETFAATVTAAPGFAFSVRPDASFPVSAAMHVSDFLAYPNAPEGSVGDWGVASSSSWGTARGTVQGVAASAILTLANSETFSLDGAHLQETHNSAVSGAQATQVQLTLSAGIAGGGANYVTQYCGPFGDRPCDTMFAGVGPIHVEARFTPTIYVDERFVRAVPEPASLTLLLAGLGALAVRVRRRAAR